MSHTKNNILAQHATNRDLSIAAPPLTTRTSSDFASDEIFVPLDERIISGTAEALESGQTHYVDVPGIAPLRAAVADYLREATQATTQAANVVITAGIQESRFLTIQMIGENFDRIAMPSVVHPGVRRALGVRPMPVEMLAADAPSGYLTPVSEIQRALAAGARFFYLESPARLTGASYSELDTSAIADLAAQYEATIIWDQGLAPWAASAPSLAAYAAEGAQIITIGEAFPGMGLSSWFIAYIASPQTLIPAMQSQKQIMAICTSTASQYGALEASRLFSEKQSAYAHQLQHKQSALRDLLAQQNIEVLPGDSATVLAFRADAAPHLSEDMANGADFGAPGVWRVTVSFSSTSEAILNSVSGKGLAS